MTTYPEIILKPTNGQNWELAVPCFVPKFNINIPAGSITNLTSTPKILWWLIPPHGATKKASIVHDYLIRNHDDKIYADVVFLYLLQQEVSNLQAITMYLAITIFKRFRNKIEKKS